jgi:serine-type D-Ala-D-Ala carboxypeptidase (penicillin-binding protein 5/6)
MKRKSILCIVFALFLINQILVFPVNAEGVAIKVEAKSALLMEPISGKVIYEVNSHEKLPLASVTKIMTMLLTMEAIDSGKIHLSDKVTISETAKKMGGSSMILDTGEIRTVEELLKGIAIASGNDAAVAMAEYLSGSEDAFVGVMNERAKALGMNETTFKNCTGLSAVGHISSANDISIMSRELIKHQSILKYTGTYMETISEGRKSPIGLVNHNKLVRFFKGCDGLKTGFTDDAKYCISATATRDGVRMLSIIMGAPTYKTRNRDCSMLLNYGFSKYEVKKVITKDMELDKIYFNKQSDKYFIAKAKDELNVILEKGMESKIDKKYEINKDKREYKKGEIIGKCEIYLNNNLYGKVNIYCDRYVKKSGIFELLENNLRKIFDNAI